MDKMYAPDRVLTHLLFSFLLCTHTVAAVHTLAKLTATCARPHPPPKGYAELSGQHLRHLAATRHMLRGCHRVQRSWRHAA